MGGEGWAGKRTIIQPRIHAKKTADIILKVMNLNIGRQRDHLRLARWVKPTRVTQGATQPTFAGGGHMKNIRGGQPLGQRPAPGKKMEGFSLTATKNQIQSIT